MFARPGLRQSVEWMTDYRRESLAVLAGIVRGDRGWEAVLTPAGPRAAGLTPLLRLVGWTDAAVRGLIRRRGSGRAAVSLPVPACSSPTSRAIALRAGTPALRRGRRRLPSGREGNLDAMPHDPLEGVRQVRRELAAAIRSRPIAAPASSKSVRRTTGTGGAAPRRLRPRRTSRSYPRTTSGSARSPPFRVLGVRRPRSPGGQTLDGSVFHRYPVTTEDFDDLLDRIVEGLVTDAVAEG